MGDGGLAALGVEVGDVHALGGDGLAHDRAELVVAHRAGVGGLAPQTDGVDGHVHRSAAGVGLAVLYVAVKVDAVAAHCCKFHRE